MTVQSRFNVTLPTTDTAGNVIAAAQLTSLVFVVNSVDYPYPIPSGTPAGASLVVPFTAIAFSPVAGTNYSADVFAVEANGNGTPSGTITWVEGAVPTAPTGFSVS